MPLLPVHDGDSCLTDCRARGGEPLCDLLYARVESSRVGWVEYRAKCWLFAIAYCCPFGCWLKLCLLWNSINLNLLHWRDVISFFFPLPSAYSACLPAPIHLQFSLLSVLTDDCVLWQLMSVSAIRGPRKNSEHCSLPKSIWPSGQRNVKYQGI